MDTTEHALISAIGGYTLAAKHDSREMSAPARQAAENKLNTSLIGEVDPDGQLPPDELARRLKAARSAYFARLAHKRYRNESTAG